MAFSDRKVPLARPAGRPVTDSPFAGSLDLCLFQMNPGGKFSVSSGLGFSG